MRKRVILLALDIAIILLATLVAVELRDNFETRWVQWVGLAPYVQATILTAVPVLCLFGLDRAIWRISSMLDYLIVSGAAVTIVTLSVGLGFVFNRLDGVARSLPILQTVFMICGLVGFRVLARLRHSYRSRQRAQPKEAMLAGQRVPYENILIVGLGRIAELYVQSVDEFGAGGKRVVGLLGLADRHSGRLIHQHPVLGPTEEILAVLQDLEVHGVFVDRIVVTLPFAKLPVTSRQALVGLGKTSKIKLDLFAEQFEVARDGPGHQPGDNGLTAAVTDGLAAQASPAPTAGAQSTGTVKILPRVGNYWSAKRAIDIAGAAILIVVLLPVFLLVAVLVAVDVGMPLLFWQQRPGVGRQPFRVYKFRTMCGAYDWHGKRVPDEKRSSPIGRLLRRSRMDELPQLFNILTGHMSFVGPRPLLAVDQCDSDETRLLIRPGLTGWAQVNGGRLLSISDKMALDLWYLQNASFGVDVRIVIKTVAMLLFGEHRDQDAIRSALNALNRPGGTHDKSVVAKPAAGTAGPFDGPKQKVA